MIPSIDSPLWQTLKVPETTRKSIIQRRATVLFVGPTQWFMVGWLVGWIGDFEVPEPGFGTFSCTVICVWFSFGLRESRHLHFLVVAL